MTEGGERGQTSLQGDFFTPEILSTVPLPIKPSNGATTSPASASLGSTSEKRFTHVLPLRAVNPRMDLVAIVSRDVNVQIAGTQAGQVGVAPPPAGLSAARSQALMRMRMAARAKALAAAGLPPEADGDNGSASTSKVKLARCATLRLSLWRMASVAGEEGTRVWDVAIGVPERFEEPAENEQELEDMTVEASCWRPDGLVLAMVLNVVRRDAASSPMSCKRHERFACLYALHDGKQLSIVPLTGKVSQRCTSIRWDTLRESSCQRVPGSADYVLARMGPLADLKPQQGEEQESKAKQRQRMFHAMRTADREKKEEDRKAEELVVHDPRGLGKAVLEHPRDLPQDKDQQSLPARTGLASSISSTRRSRTVLQALCDDRVHLLLDGVFYLGGVDLRGDARLTACSPNDRTGVIHAVGVSSSLDQSVVRLHDWHIGMLPSSPTYQTADHVAVLSTHSYTLIAYAHDAIVAMRSRYKSLHEDCVAPWNRQARLTAKRYDTDLSSEMIMLLCTGFANDTVLAVLLGNEAMSEKDNARMAGNATFCLDSLTRTARYLTNALQRLLIVFEEVRGCMNWNERYCGLFGQSGSAALLQSEGDVMSILKCVQDLLKQISRLIGNVKREASAWTHFYRWWTYERVRQDALRDKKSPAEAVAAAGGEVSCDVMLLLEFLGRGFDNFDVEQVLGITLDAKTRGEEVEDDDEEEGEEGEEGVGGRRSAGRTARKQLELQHANGQALEMEESRVEGEGAESGWYENGKLDRQLGATLDVLAAPPKITELFENRHRQPPSAMDVAQHSDGLAGLYAGPSLDLHSRLRQGDGAVQISSNVIIAEILSTASAFFVRVFSSWTGQFDQATEAMSVEGGTVQLTVNAGIANSRREAIESLAGSSADRSLSKQGALLLRSSLDDLRQRHRLIFFTEDDRTDEVQQTLVVIDREVSEVNSVRYARTRLDAGVRVTALDFFSFDEAVALLHNVQTNVTTLVSIRLDELRFEEKDTCLHAQDGDLPPAQYCRLARLDRSQAGAAVSLSANKQKDVCATLDEDGHLVYWDMVLQQTAGQEDDM